MEHAWVLFWDMLGQKHFNELNVSQSATKMAINWPDVFCGAPCQTVWFGWCLTRLSWSLDFLYVNPHWTKNRVFLKLIGWSVCCVVIVNISLTVASSVIVEENWTDPRGNPRLSAKCWQSPRKHSLGNSTKQVARMKGIETCLFSRKLEDMHVQNNYLKM